MSFRSLATILSTLVVIKLMCMVNMGNSASSRTTRDETFYNDNNISDVSISCIKAHLKSGRPAKEFRILETEEPTCDDTITEAHRTCNKEKNRYVNILPCDSTRVRLAPIAGVDGSDYINANFIDGDGTERAYIATQGPLMHTRGDFWRMVWENNSSIVVMLGKEKENDRVKVDRYWPEEGEPPLHFHNIRVTLKQKQYDANQSIAVRTLELSYFPSSSHPSSNDQIGQAQYAQYTHPQAQTRKVLHYQYEGWPDHGVPPSAAPIRELVRTIEKEKEGAQHLPTPQPSPMVVHCSAGVGRTGTFVTIHMTLLRLFHELRENGIDPFKLPLQSSSNSFHSKQNNSNNTPQLPLTLTSKFNLYNTVLKLRRQRPGMVQQQEQYVFCYEAVAEEAEHMGLIPASPVLPRPRMLSVSTSSLPSPSSSSSNLRTSSSSYVASPTSIPPSPTFLDSSGYTSNFLNSSMNSLPSPPSSPYLRKSQDLTPLPSPFLRASQDTTPLPSPFLHTSQDSTPLPSPFLRASQDSTTSLPSPFLHPTSLDRDLFPPEPRSPLYHDPCDPHTQFPTLNTHPHPHECATPVDCRK
eukprot:Phypoly_transcript_04146.p1 GENE.Phypoly_transcript_04146~~Phypoly_transcript_04146.p1  ORF type:complete len:580 (+),score=86.30 Phypoly_transcript_04146:82-1821(+)